MNKKLLILTALVSVAGAQLLAHCKACQMKHDSTKEERQEYREEKRERRKARRQAKKESKKHKKHSKTTTESE